MKKKHPEQRKGEVFYGNFLYIHFEKITWKSKRHGVIAYDKKGGIISQPTFVDGEHFISDWGERFFPVFVSKKEIEKEIERLKEFIENSKTIT